MTAASRIFTYTGLPVPNPAVAQNAEATLYSGIVPGGTLPTDGGFFDIFADGKCVSSSDVRLVIILINGGPAAQVQIDPGAVNWQFNLKLYRADGREPNRSKLAATDQGVPNQDGAVHLSNGAIAIGQAVNFSNDVEVTVVCQNQTEAMAAASITGYAFTIVAYP